MKKALITGVSGFVGSHLSEYLLSQGIEIIGITHPKFKSDNLKTFIHKIDIRTCNIMDKRNLKKTIENEQFDYVFHLAAFSSPTQSVKDPQETIENNVICQLNLLEILSKMKTSAKILIIGSSEEYGDVENKYIPVNEEAPLNPATPYAVSKITQDFLGLQYFLHQNLKIVRVRPFNHIGPRHSTAFVIPAFASQIAQIEKVGKGQLKVGNLDAWRDFTDVRDICRAYLLALDKGKLGDVYNIGSGNVYKIADILEKLISFSSAKIKVVQEESLMRENDTKKVVCDFSKFKNDTGWQPKISIDTTLFDTIEYERKK